MKRMAGRTPLARQIPEESYGAMDFGLTMEEYEPESYVPSAPRVSHTPIASSLSNLPARSRHAEGHVEAGSVRGMLALLTVRTRIP